ncbi:polymerase delta-interacting protein 2 [Cichlidogyrus casuarinus]|uniref:Polymerase delta-interacting protein 2 n=1 Tax=Cichlidogyrus casuarinus TaxID=1844966 RepID=A0ABD2Q2H1_9PLAT
MISLESIGEAHEPSKQYEPGQLFVHKHFGYRGVVMSSWKGKLFDRDQIKQKNDDFSEVTLYQVLTDDRDMRNSDLALKSGITFLPDSKDVISTIYIVSGMDYAWHDDLIPYRTGNLNPITNDYVSDFFAHDGDSRLIPTDALAKYVHLVFSPYSTHQSEYPI